MKLKEYQWGTEFFVGSVTKKKGEQEYPALPLIFLRIDVIVVILFQIDSRHFDRPLKVFAVCVQFLDF